MSFSIIIPVYNEEESIGFVLDELGKLYPKAEILVINDGSDDDTSNVVSLRENVKLLSFDKRRGQSHATWHGLTHASHEVCVLMDGDGECDPTDIQTILNTMENYDFCCGYRMNRKRNLLNRTSSVFANKIRQLILGDRARDTGAMKGVRKKHIYLLPKFEGLHRFIPTFLHHAGLSMKEVPLHTRKRIGGRTKYTLHKRALAGIVDILHVKKLLTNKPHAHHTI